MPINEKKKKEFNSQSNERSIFLNGIIIPTIVAVIVASITTIVTNQIQLYYNQPKLEVLGALPIFIAQPQISEKESGMLGENLAFIIKIENSSPTPAIVHTALLDGCVSLSYLAWEKNRQKEMVRIIMSATMRTDSNTIPPYGVSYVWVEFPLNTKISLSISKVSFSTNNVCENAISNTIVPSVSQLIELEDEKKLRVPKCLRPEFKTGQISITILIGGNQVRVPPELINDKIVTTIDTLIEKRSSSEIYENPDSFRVY